MSSSRNNGPSSFSLSIAAVCVLAIAPDVFSQEIQEKQVFADIVSYGSTMYGKDDQVLIQNFKGVDLFRKVGNQIEFEQYIEPGANVTRPHYYAIHGDWIALGCNGDDGRVSDTGAVYAFQFDGTQWVEKQKLFARDGEKFDGYHAVALEDDLLVVGAGGRDSFQLNTGRVYVYRHDGSKWTEREILLPDDPVKNGIFGNRVIATDPQNLLIASMGADGYEPGKGAVYWFSSDTIGGPFTQRAKFFPDDKKFGYFNFGWRMAYDPVSRRAAIAAADPAGLGRVYTYLFQNDTWTLEQYIVDWLKNIVCDRTRNGYRGMASSDLIGHNFYGVPSIPKTLASPSRRSRTS